MSTDSNIYVYVVIADSAHAHNIASIIQGAFISGNGAMEFVNNEVEKLKSQAMGKYLTVAESTWDWPKIVSISYTIGSKQLPGKIYKILRLELRGNPLEILGLQAE